MPAPQARTACRARLARGEHVPAWNRLCSLGPPSSPGLPPPTSSPRTIHKGPSPKEYHHDVPYVFPHPSVCQGWGLHPAQEGGRRCAERLESAHQPIDQVGATQGGSRLPLAPRLDGNHVLVLRISEMVRVRGAGSDPLHQQRPADLLALPGVRHPWRQLVSRRRRMAVWGAAVPRLLEQAPWHSGRPGVDRHLRRHGHHHSVHAERLGRVRRGLPRHGRQCALSHEGCRAARRLHLSLEARRRAGPGTHRHRVKPAFAHGAGLQSRSLALALNLPPRAPKALERDEADCHQESEMAGISKIAAAEKLNTRRIDQQTSGSNQIVVVFQGGGALGAYQAGVYAALHEAGIEPDWIIGTSIGAINASLIAGNEVPNRVERVEEFWERVADK